MADRLKNSGIATVARLDEARNKIKEQSDEHSKKRTKEQSKKLAKELSDGHPGGLSDTLTDCLTDERTDSLTVSHKDSQGGGQINTPKHMHKHTLTGGPGDNPYFWMTKNQAAVLAYLNTIYCGKTRLNDISQNTGVPYGTVRKALTALERNDCITKPKKTRIGQWQGMHVELLEAGKQWVTLRDSLNNICEATLNNTLAGGHSGGHSGGHTFISSSSYKKTTTIKNFEHEFLNHPELGYWRQKGLKFKQINNWTQEFDLDHHDLIQFLCYCRYDMVENDKEKTESIKNVFNWFYRIIERSGSYPPPANYKSHQEKKIEREKARAEQLKAQLAELKKARKEALQAQRELDFEQMLEDPESQEYQQCHNRIPDIVKSPRKRGTISFATAMKKAYCEINDIELF
jgi:hypothetical protein